MLYKSVYQRGPPWDEGEGWVVGRQVVHERASAAPLPVGMNLTSHPLTPFEGGLVKHMETLCGARWNTMP